MGRRLTEEDRAIGSINIEQIRALPQRTRDVLLEKEIAGLLEKENTDDAWILTGYMGSAVLKRKWYTRIKAALPAVEKER